MKVFVVIDTNVLVSALLSSRYTGRVFGNPKNIIEDNIQNIQNTFTDRKDKNHICKLVSNEDIAAGLSAEIEKRRQQYEYYRDKLLTFKRKEYAQQ